MTPRVFPAIEGAAVSTEQGWPEWFTWPDWLPLRDAHQLLAEGTDRPWLKSIKALMPNLTAEELELAILQCSNEIEILRLCDLEIGINCEDSQTVIRAQLRDGQAALESCLDLLRDHQQRHRTSHTMRRLGLSTHDASLFDIVASLQVDLPAAFISATAVIGWIEQHRNPGTLAEIDAQADAIPGTAMTLMKMGLLELAPNSNVIRVVPHSNRGGHR